MPAIAAASRRCLKMNQPTTAVSTMPTPDQMAYTTPIGSTFSVSDRQ